MGLENKLFLKLLLESSWVYSESLAAVSLLDSNLIWSTDSGLLEIIDLVSGNDKEKLKLDVNDIKRLERVLVDSKEASDNGYK